MAVTDRADVKSDYTGPVNRTWAIFLISVLGLFLEMLLIRWIGTEIRIFAYLQNTVLVVCFMGLGLGCLTSRQPIVLPNSLVPLFLISLLLAVPMTRDGLGMISPMLSVIGDLPIWGEVISDAKFWQAVLYVGLGLALTYLIMVMVMETFVPIGRILGRLMDDHPNTIWAYSVNVAGSLAGTWLFVTLSFFYQPPVTWFLVFAALMLFFVGRPGGKTIYNILLLAGIVILAWFAGQAPGSLGITWSPYQKLVLWKSDPATTDFGKYVLTVNNTGYQVIIPLKEPYEQPDPKRFPPEMKGYGQYDIPSLLNPHPASMLVVGSGTGNDVAGALMHNVKKVTAVEIDPAIISFGRRYHPDMPYSSPAVQVVNDDARSFFATCTDKYDVISFGLLDSHTTTAMTNARLDHYVYTRESIKRARSLLAPGGIMALSFEATKPYIADRMAGVLRDVFGTEPICFRVPGSGYGWGGVMFIEGDLDTARKQITANPGLASLIDKWQKAMPLNINYSTKLTTDDWPYIYLAKPRIPVLYFLMAGLMVLLVIRSRKYIRLAGLPGGLSREHWHFFFLGAAFLLLEVQNISKASVILGNTWDVNAVIVSGVLAMILGANLLAARFPRINLAVVYTALCLTCLGLYFVDLARFAFLPYAMKALVVGSLTAMPMLFSGIVFIRSFAYVDGKDTALGANLIGALSGAMLQSVTFATGIKALLLIVMALYIMAMLTRPRGSERGALRADAAQA